LITSFYNYINFSKEINSKLINEDENLGIGSIEREVMNVKNIKNLNIDNLKSIQKMILY
jgi:hypothetical protein